MDELIDTPASIRLERTHGKRLVSTYESDYDIALDDHPEGETPVDKLNDKVQQDIDRMKRANKSLFRADVKPVILDDFQDLILPEKLEEIKASKGRLKINKLLYDADQVSDILSMVVTKLMRGAPGDSGSAALKKNADLFAIKIAPKIAEIRQNPECKTYREVAAELTKRGIPTDRGEEQENEWQHTSVRNIEIRIQKLTKAGRIKPV